MKRVARIAIEIALPIALVIIWWVLSSNSTSPYWPPLSKILMRLREYWFWDGIEQDLVPSVRNLAIGYAAAAVLGIGIGLVVSRIDSLYRALTPIFEFGRSLSSIAVLPLMVIFFGIGTPMKLAIITYACFWPILLNTVDGVRGIDPTLYDVARAYKMNPFETVRYYIAPAAGPQILQGLRTSITLGVTVIVFSEFVGADHGIGYFILQSTQSFAIVDMWTGIIMLGALGYLLSVLFRFGDRRVLFWYYGRQRAAKD